MLREQQLAFASKHVDTIQIGAPNMQNFGLLKAVAQTGVTRPRHRARKFGSRASHRLKPSGRVSYFSECDWVISCLWGRPSQETLGSLYTAAC